MGIVTAPVIIIIMKVPRVTERCGYYSIKSGFRALGCRFWVLRFGYVTEY